MSWAQLWQTCSLSQRRPQTRTASARELACAVHMDSCQAKAISIAAIHLKREPHRRRRFLRLTPPRPAAQAGALPTMSEIPANNDPRNQRRSTGHKSRVPHSAQANAVPCFQHSILSAHYSRFSVSTWAQIRYLENEAISWRSSRPCLPQDT